MKLLSFIMSGNKRLITRRGSRKARNKVQKIRTVGFLFINVFKTIIQKFPFILNTFIDLKIL